VGQVTDLQKNQVGTFVFSGTSIWVARTGYTGEDGFEIVAPADSLPAIWESMMATGHDYGLQPAGLGARDTLRTEMGYPLYGHELDAQTTPLEAGLGYFVALDKGDFLGGEVLRRQKAEGISRKCVAFKMTDKSAPPRPQYPIWSPEPSGARIGVVVSGTQSPSLGLGIGMGYVPPAFAKADTRLEIEIRGKHAPAVVVAKPIYRKA
jgi:aminomethyltransferase